MLVIFGYSLDTDDPDVANAVLNVARHGFTCSVRFASMPLEWIWHLGTYVTVDLPILPTSVSLSFELSPFFSV